MIFRNFIATLVLFVSLVLPSINIAAAKFHRYHTSLTRMDYNAKEKIIETSIQIFTHDLVPVLEEKTKKKIDLEKTENIDKLIFDFISENFALKNEKGELMQMKWVGKEFDVDTAWVYLEIPTDKSPENFNLQNTLFFGNFPEQTNLVTARFDEKKVDLIFKVGDKSKEIKQNITVAEN